MMIPTTPEVLCATHVEYIPLPPACLAVRNNGNPVPADHLEMFTQRAVSRKLLAQIKAYRSVRKYAPVNMIGVVPRAMPYSYFQGVNLQYHPYVVVPPAMP